MMFFPVWINRALKARAYKDIVGYNDFSCREAALFNKQKLGMLRTRALNVMSALGNIKSSLE